MISDGILSIVEWNGNVSKLLTCSVYILYIIMFAVIHLLTLFPFPLSLSFFKGPSGLKKEVKMATELETFFRNK